MTGRHRHHWWIPLGRWAARHPVPAGAAGFAVLTTAVVAAGALVGPSPDLQPGPQPITPSIGTAHASGTKPWRTVVPPTIGASGAWEPSQGPVIVNGQPLPTTTPATRRPSSRTTPPSSTSSTPRVDAADQPAADPHPQPGVAAELLELVNRDRLANGCGPVTLNPSLLQQSQQHAEEQAAADRMFHSAGVTGFDTWGENVAYGYDTAAAVHAGWMGSPPHRANILNCTYTVMGAGAADSATGVRYWTEQFAAA